MVSRFFFLVFLNWKLVNVWMMRIFMCVLTWCGSFIPWKQLKWNHSREPFSSPKNKYKLALVLSILLTSSLSFSIQIFLLIAWIMYFVMNQGLELLIKFALVWRRMLILCNGLKLTCLWTFWCVWMIQLMWSVLPLFHAFGANLVCRSSLQFFL